MNTAKQIKFMVKEAAQGWTVIEREGSKKMGFKDRQVHAGGVTMHTAQAIAATMSNDYARHGIRPESAGGERGAACVALCAQ